MNVATVLIVDAARGNLGAICVKLHESGYRVVVVSDGKEGVQRAQRMQPDLILLEVRLPDISGFDVCRHLKAQESTRDIPVVFLTESITNERKGAIFGAGGADYLTKPLHIEEVLARISAHIGLRGARRRLAAQSVQLLDCQEKLARLVSERAMARGESKPRCDLEATKPAFTEATWSQADTLHRSVFATMAEGVVVQDGEGRIIAINRAAEDILGRTAEQVSGRGAESLWSAVREDGGLVAAEDHPFMSTLRTGQPQSDVVVGIFKPDGVIAWISVNSRPLFHRDESKPYAVVMTFRDVAERKRVQERLHMMGFALNKVREAMYIIRGMRFIDVNDEACRVLGYGREELLGMTVFDIDPDSSREELESIAATIYAGATMQFERRHRAKDGRIFPVEINTAHFDYEGRLASIVLARDMTERRRMEDALLESELQFRSLAENAPDNIARYDRQGRTLYMNPQLGATLGVDACDVVGKTLWEANPDRFDPGYASLIAAVTETGQPGETTVVVSDPRRGTRYHHVRLVAERGAGGEIIGALALGRDVTEHKTAEDVLRRLNRELQAIRNCNRAVIRAADEQTLLNDVCRIVCDEAGYHLAWVGYAESDAAKSVRPVAWAGVDDEYVKHCNATWAGDVDSGQGPVGTAIRSGEVFHVRDFEAEPAMRPWRESALQRGYRSAVALPLKDGGARAFGVLVIYSTEINGFAQDEIRLLEELSNDLAFGLRVLRTRVSHARIEQELIQRELTHRAVLENIPDLIVRYDADLRRTYVNPAWEKASGLSAKAVMGKPGVEILRDDNEPANLAYAAKLREVLATGSYQETELTWKNAQGVALHLEYALVPEWDELGRVAGVLAVGRDVTERKQVERERLAHLRFFENMDRVNRAIQGADELEPMMRQVLDIARSVFDCDRAFLMYPCDPDADTWCSPMESDRPEYPGLLAQGLVVPMTDSAAAALAALLDADGPVTFGPGGDFPLPEEAATRYDIKSFMSMALSPKIGKPWQFGVHQCSHARRWTLDERMLLREIGRRLADGLSTMLAHRQLRGREQEYRELGDNAPDLIVRYDLACRRTYVNPAFSHVTGIASDAALNAKPEPPWGGNIPVPEYVKRLERVMATGEPDEVQISWKREANGPISHHSLRMVAERGLDGRVKGVLSIGRDITSRMEAEHLLRASRAHLREFVARRETAREEERRHIARELHDELGQRLMALMLALDMLGSQHGKGQPRLRKAVKTLQDKVTGIIRIVRAVSCSLRPPVLDTGIVAALEWLKADFSQSTGISCTLDAPRRDVDLREELSVAIFRITQESLTNAARHARAERVQISLREEGLTYLLEISDNGIGFDTDTCGKRKSFGLLGIRERALAIGGEASVSSSPGTGTLVRVRIPVE